MSPRSGSEGTSEVNDEQKAFVAASIELRKRELQRGREDQERERVRLSEIAAERRNTALAQLRTQLALVLSVVWVGWVATQIINITLGLGNTLLDNVGLFIIYSIHLQYSYLYFRNICLRRA
jgi:hypothetical protein